MLYIYISCFGANRYPHEATHFSPLPAIHPNSGEPFMSQPYVGEIRMFAGNFAPLGWMFCNGQLLPIASYEVLFALIGTTYGGDGQNTFALPNLQSRIPIHQGPGFTLGQMGGAESVALTANQIPPHNHSPQVNNNWANTPSPQGAVWGNGGLLGRTYGTAGSSVAMNSQAIQQTGGNQPHDNMLPYLTVNFIIAYAGIFPPQN
jgi:microcystin-dependent protein